MACLLLAGAGPVSASPEFGRSLTIDMGLQGRVMWVDCTANLDRIMTLDGVKDVVARCKRANFTMIVVDVKPVSGQVIYNSKIAPHLRTWKGREYPDFDALAAFVSEGHKAGLQVEASINVFAEGHKYYNVGVAYSRPEWQSIAYVVDRTLVAPGGFSLPIRAEDEPADPARTVVHDTAYVQEPTAQPGQQLAVSVDAEGRVAGIIDPALLDNEPLTAPEDGRLLVIQDGQMDWASQHLRAGDHVVFRADGRREKVTDAPSEKVAAFCNPLIPDVRRYEISLMKEIVANYDVDGIALDRMRYANVYNDYSDLSRAAFERWLGHPVAHWPDDVLQFDPIPGRPVRRGPLFKPWLEFRARVIRDFLAEATDAMRSVKPNLQFGVYVGSWFGEYYGVGVNWGSEKFPVRTPWASPDYNQAGYAEFLDWVSTGCYYPIPTREAAVRERREEGGTVEAAADLSTTAVANSAPVYAGLYALNYRDNPKDFLEAIQAAERHSQGVMIFDLSYIYDYNWWDLLYQAFSTPVLPPDRSASLEADLRYAADAVLTAQELRAGGAHLPAVPWQPGGG